MTLISKYATSFYGSSLWSFFDGICDKLFTAWNDAVRDIFDIPRFLKFHKTLKSSLKPCRIYLSLLSSSNSQTVYCQNLMGISDICNVRDKSEVTIMNIKRSMKYNKAAEDQNGGFLC